MKKYRIFQIVLIVLVASAGLATPAHAITGTVRVVVAKAGFVVGAGGGRGVLTFRDRDYPFTVQGLSLGLTAGASVNKLVGRASYLHELRDFEGTYIVVGAGGALLGGGGVRLKNAKRDPHIAGSQGRRGTVGQRDKGGDHPGLNEFTCSIPI